MRLTELNPTFLGYGGPGILRKNAAGELEEVPRREGVGITCDCPCGKCGAPLYVPFAIALDGAPSPHGEQGWQRTGDTFETLTLTPSILRVLSKGGCGWHGYITTGEVTSC